MRGILIILMMLLIVGCEEKRDNAVTIKKGASSESKNVGYEVTPLIAAIQNDQYDLAKKILDQGADPNDKIPTGGSALTFSGMKNDVKYLKLMLDNGGDPNFIHGERKEPLILYVVSPGKLEYIKLLVEAGADINVADDSGETALMVSVSLNQFDIAYFLLMQGADFKKKNIWGNDITYYMDKSRFEPGTSIYDLREKVDAFLIEHGAYINK